MNKEEVLETINQIYKQIEYENQKGRTILNEYHKSEHENTNLKQAINEIRDYNQKIIDSHLSVNEETIAKINLQIIAKVGDDNNEKI